MATSDANGANGAKGRPSLPDYLPQENLAIALAAQKASMKPDQTGSELEAGTKELYAAMLREVQATHGWPVVVWKAKNGGDGVAKPPPDDVWTKKPTREP